MKTLPHPYIEGVDLRNPFKKPLRIEGFADALAAALGIADRFERGHASVALDSEGTVLDLTCFAGPDHTVMTALGWADCLSFNEPRFKSLILIGRR
ncbi:MAG: hypothetical protein ACR2ME_06100 [Acidimicrobiia bacterium]